jgi:hypothetical protein
MRCTKHFPQLLNLEVLIAADINSSALPNSAAFHLQTFWDSFFENDKLSMVQNKNLYTSLIQASAGLTITSMVIAPICLGIIILMYMLKRPRYSTVATCFALFDAALMVTAATLWITASIKYSSDIESALGGPPTNNTSFWGDTDVIPLSYGLFLFAGVAIFKVIVLPIMALICLILILLLIVAAIIMAWLMLLALKCFFVMLSACDNGRTTETVYYGSAYNGMTWGGDSGGGGDS